MISVILSDQAADRLHSATEPPARLIDLHAQAIALRTRMLQVKGEYEAGALSLDEELTQIRALQGQVAAVSLLLHDLAATPTRS